MPRSRRRATSAPVAALRAVAGVLTAGALVAGCAAEGPRVERADRRPGPASTGSPTAGTSGAGRHQPLPVRTGWGPTAAEIGRARRLVDGLSLRQRAGQVIVASYSGTAAPTRLVHDLHLGGVVAFSENLTSADQAGAVNRRLQASERAAGRPFPLLVGIDQEGGLVSRVATGATGFPAFMSAGAARDPALTRSAYAAAAAELARMGFTSDFAPDADVTAGPADPVIGSRSAGSSPGLVTQQAGAAAAGLHDSGLLPVLKHFPGHGSVTTDSHLALPVQHRSVRELSRTDLRPFASLVRGGAPAVMVGHLDVRAVDPHVPSSLSRKVVTGLLRDRLGFDGLAVTDSLQMGAVTGRYGSAASAVRALRAGEDVLLMPPDPRVARAAVAAAVRRGRLPQARLDQAATRMVAWLLHQRAERRRLHPTGALPAATASARLSARALTSVAGPCSGRLVGRAVSVSGAAGAVGTFRAAARAAGLPVRLAGTPVHLVGRGEPAPRSGVVVATDTPYVLGRSGGTARLATYGVTPGAMQALVQVLLGRAPAPGRLPVDVPGVARDGC